MNLTRLNAVKKIGLILCVFLAGFITYDLSLGPIFRLCLKGVITHSFFMKLYNPVFYLEENIPVLRKFNLWYYALWFDESMTGGQLDETEQE